MSRGKKETLGEKARQIGLLLIFLPFLLPLVLIGLALFFAYRAVLYLLVWTLWLPRGKRILLVYSDSTIWRDYFVNEMIPLLEDSAVILNWSERKQWPKWSLEVRIFRNFGGRANFNPLVLVFHPLRPVEQFRFWEPFKYWKKGNTEPVERMKRNMLDYLQLRY